MSIPQPGDLAPDFQLPDEAGRPVRLSQFRGQPVILYFYPKDDTPGCTIEACAFRDDYAAYERAGAILLGVSPDDPKSHTKFKEKFNLPFPLLADVGHRVCELYGVWGPKTFRGREYMGVRRTTFLIGPDGRVLRTFEAVKPEGHSAELLQALEETRAVG